MAKNQIGKNISNSITTFFLEDSDYHFSSFIQYPIRDLLASSTTYEAEPATKDIEVTRTDKVLIFMKLTF